MPVTFAMAGFRCWIHVNQLLQILKPIPHLGQFLDVSAVLLRIV